MGLDKGVTNAAEKKVNWNFYSGINGAVTYIKDGSIASDFGVPKEKGNSPSLQVMLDIFMICFSLAAGPYWNKCQCPQSLP